MKRMTTTVSALALALLLAGCAGSSAKADVSANGAPNAQATLDTAREYNDKGALVAEMVFPKSFKAFYDDGTPKMEGAGELYKDSAGAIRMANGTAAIYFPDGKLASRSVWEGGNAQSMETWNEKGILVGEVRYPAFARKYYDNGSPAFELVGELYRKGPEHFELENGHERMWHWNGQLAYENTVRNRNLVAKREWRENGDLSGRIDLDSGRCESIRPDGSPDWEMVGSIYIKDTSASVKAGNLNLHTPTCNLMDGVAKGWHENGRLRYKTVWKGGNVQFQEEWNEDGRRTREFRKDSLGRIFSREWSDDGTLTAEVAMPDSVKAFSPKTGKPTVEIRGSLYRSKAGGWMPKDGTAKLFDEEGNLLRVLTYKDSLVRSAEYPGGGTVVELRRDSLDNLREFRFVRNGTPVETASGFLREIMFHFGKDEYGVHVKTGEKTTFFPDGKEKRRETFREDKLLSMREWHENRKLAREADMTSYKEWREDGTLRLEAAGTLVWEDGEFQLKDGKLRLFGPDGKTVEQSVEYRDFNPVSK